LKELTIAGERLTVEVAGKFRIYEVGQGKGGDDRRGN